MKVRKLATIIKNNNYSHIIVEKRWNYFDGDYDYYLIRIIVDENGKAKKYEERITREYGRELMGEGKGLSNTILKYKYGR